MSAPAKERPSLKKTKLLLEAEREKLFTRLEKLNEAIRAAEAESASAEKVSLKKLRADLGWTRSQLARVMNASERAIVNWEGGEPMSPVYAAKVREVQSIYNELQTLMKREEIGGWLVTEMDEFEGRTPAELISKGETGRVWSSLFYLRSGMPD